MSRLDELTNAIDTYALNKNELDSYKKICDKENAEIKALMTELELDKAVTDDYTASLIVQHRETMDEDMLLEVLINNGYRDLVVRTREYVDMDLLENAIYHSKIDKDTLLQMNNCKQVKEVQTLKIAKRKKEK